MNGVTWALQKYRAYVVMSIWLLSTAIAAVPIFAWSYYNLQFNDQICLMDTSPEKIVINSSFSITHFLTCVIAPVIILGICYTSVYKKSKTNGNASVSAKATKRSRTVMRKCAYFVSSFAICRLPYGIGSLAWTWTGSSIGSIPLLVALSLLGTTSLILNPILYVILNSEYSKGVPKIVCRKQSVCRKDDKIDIASGAIPTVRKVTVAQYELLERQAENAMLKADDISTAMLKADDISTAMLEVDDISTAMLEADDMSTAMLEADDSSIAMLEADGISTAMLDMLEAGDISTAMLEADDSSIATTCMLRRRSSNVVPT